MREHYIPQFLLRQWADPRTDDLRLFKLLTRGVVSAPCSPTGTGYEEDTLALTVDRLGEMDKHDIETKFFQKLDNEAHAVHQKLLAGEIELPLKDRKRWTRLIMSLRARQPDVVRYLRDEASTHLVASLADKPAEYEAAAAGITAPPTLTEWTKQTNPGLIENAGVTFFPGIVDNLEYAEKIWRLEWSVCDFSPCQDRLLIGDRPCVFTARIDDPDLIIYLPISPSLGFFATRGERSLSALRGQPLDALLNLVNDSTVRQAKFRIFAKDQALQAFIEERRPSGPNPDWTPPSRQRVEG